MLGRSEHKGHQGTKMAHSQDTRQLAEAVVTEEETPFPETKRRRRRANLLPKRHEFLLSMEPFKPHNPGGGPFVGPPKARAETTGAFVPIPSTFQFREEEMIHFDDKLAAAAPNTQSHRPRTLATQPTSYTTTRTTALPTPASPRPASPRPASPRPASPRPASPLPASARQPLAPTTPPPSRQPTFASTLLASPTRNTDTDSTFTTDAAAPPRLLSPPPLHTPGSVAHASRRRLFDMLKDA